jgi:hypothetical protein
MHLNYYYMHVLVEAFAYLKGPMDMYKLYQEKYNMALQGFTLEQTGRKT